MNITPKFRNRFTIAFKEIDEAANLALKMGVISVTDIPRDDKLIVRFLDDEENKTLEAIMDLPVDTQLTFVVTSIDVNETRLAEWSYVVIRDVIRPLGFDYASSELQMIELYLNIEDCDVETLT